MALVPAGAFGDLHLADCQRMGLLVLADGGEELVCRLVSSGDGGYLSSISSCSAASPPRALFSGATRTCRWSHGEILTDDGSGDCDPHLPQPRLDAPPVPTLRLGHTPQDLGLAGVLGTFRQQLVNLVRPDLPIPRGGGGGGGGACRAWLGC